MICAVFDTKPYDREFLNRAAEGTVLEFRFLEFHLEPLTIVSADGASGVCVFVNDQVDRQVLEALANCGVRHVALRSAGYNHADLEAARRLGIVVTRVPAYSPHAVAEHAVALLMTLNRKIHRAYNRVREHNFALNGLVGFDLSEKTVGIIGTGKIGRVAARIFRGFNCNVLATDPIEDAEWAAANGVVYTSLDDLLRRSEIVSLHAPLVAETHHLLNERTFALMKKGAYIVNTSRGKLVDTRALIDCLKAGHLGGVALDVYEEEEGIFFEDHSGEVLADDDLLRLLTFPNVLVTSHQAFLTTEALAAIARVTVGNLVRVGTGQAPLAGTEL